MNKIDLSFYDTDCFYSIYARSADNKDEYYPWDDLKFKGEYEAQKVLKKLEKQHPEWQDMLVVVRTRYDIRNNKYEA